MTSGKFSHIFLDKLAKASLYKKPRLKIQRKVLIPDRDRIKHSKNLQAELATAWRIARKRKKERSAISLPTKDGIYLEFRSKSGFDLITKSLENIRAGIRLLNIKEIKEEDRLTTVATVYIPSGQQKYFLAKIKEYLEKNTPTNKPRNADLINSIEDIKIAILESFWQDLPDLIPEKQAEWCEVWLRTNRKDEEVEIHFRTLCQHFNINIQDGSLHFPERIVVLIKADRNLLSELVEASPDIAEFRRSKETARFFIEITNKHQLEWVEHLLNRTHIDLESNVAVCVLDTGVNNGHPLLNLILADGDCHTIREEWGANDDDGHGTLMCGITAYGDLQHALEGNNEIKITHKLESVKILRHNGNDNDPRLYGNLTNQAISRTEIKAPKRIRVICMAVTSKDDRDRGRPSSWSAAVDAITSGYEDDQKRLFIVSAGNINEIEELKNYPDSNLTNTIHDPAQSWNALTVGAITQKIKITDPECQNYQPLAPAGGLSPFSTTSLTWEANKWPIKPDVVLEGGNVGIDDSGFVSRLDDLSLLSISHKPIERQFLNFEATSAATAQAGWMAAQIQSVYPNAWPETIRGLIVHSAEWTEQLKNQFKVKSGKKDYLKLLRICGYGVPNLGRAISCAQNTLTLIAQEIIQPYDYQAHSKNSGYKTKDMHLYELPWPKDVLLMLGEMEVVLRITLSYFIEPGPGEIGWKDRYRYASHGFRFDLNGSSETKAMFLKRLNEAARENGEKLETSNSISERWLLGSNNRKLGSIHSDIWKGTAADIASCNLVGVYPIIGWWRERAYLGRGHKKTRYSLIVSLHTPEQSIDLYTPVANKLKIPISI